MIFYSIGMLIPLLSLYPYILQLYSIRNTFYTIPKKYDSKIGGMLSMFKKYKNENSIPIPEIK